MVWEPTLTSAPGSDRGYERRSFRELWQVPVFLAGLMALAGVWFVRPHIQRQPARLWERDLAAARQAFEATPTDLGRTLAIGKALLEGGRFPERAGEVHFLLGSADLRRAEALPPDQAPEAWRQAREHLEQALAQGVPEIDRARLTYRLGKVLFHTGADPATIIAALAASADKGAEDPAEGYGLLTQAHLRPPTPNVAAALESSRKQLALSHDDDARLAPVRLLRGELLLQVGESEEARQVLGRIRKGAPPDVYTRARRLRAESAQRDRLWNEAAQLWEEIRSDDQNAAPEPGRVLYSLGLCYRRLERPREAVRFWEKALSADSEAAQAAAFGLAELRLSGPEPGAALALFEQAVAAVTTPANYRNSMLELAEARKIFELGCQVYRDKRDFERATGLAKSYARISGPGKDRELLAQAADAWARDCQERAQRTTGAAASRLREEAVSHLREAAAAFDARAGTSPEPADQARWLWLAADRFLQAAAYPQALAAYRRFLVAEPVPERQGEGWFRVAEVHRALTDEPGSRSAFRKCIEHPGPFAFRARYELAQAEAARGNLDEAEVALKQNLDLMQGAPDDEAFEKSLRAMADLLVRRGNHRMAAVRLQEALDRYPASSAAGASRLLLADCYVKLAAQEDQTLRGGGYQTEEGRLHSRAQRRQWVQKAAAHYQKLTDDLTARAAERPLSDSEQRILLRAAFAGAECRFELGDFTGAARLYEELAVRYTDRVEALAALKQATRCYWVVGDTVQAAVALGRVRTLLKKLPDSAFPDRPDAPTRKEWEEWLEWASRQAPPARAP